MTKSDQFVYIPVTTSPTYKVSVDNDKSTSDDKLKLKLRDINLIKYNPNLFTNRGERFEVYGGLRSFLISAGFGLVFYIYRHKANTLRGIKPRAGVNYNMMIGLFGFGVGTIYNALFLSPNQRIFNDYIAHWLYKRYPNCKNLSRTNIWAYRDQENIDECYNFSSSYLNTFHF